MIIATADFIDFAIIAEMQRLRVKFLPRQVLVRVTVSALAKNNLAFHTMSPVPPLNLKVSRWITPMLLRQVLPHIV